jgi:signal transduction histidine kinase
MHPGEPTGGGMGDRLRRQEAFDFSPLAQLTTDGHGLIAEANHAAAALLRCPREFLPGKPLGLFVADGSRPRFYEALARLWQGAAADAFDTRLARRNEPPREVVVRVVRTDPAADARETAAFRWAIDDVTELRRAEAARRDLLRRLVTAQEDERGRVARELHDSVGQLLTALALAVRAARDAAPLPPPAEDRLADAERIAGDLGRAVHDLAVRLRPTALDDLGLEAAIAQQVAEWSARTGVPVDYQPHGLAAARLPPEAAAAVYRVVQEALTNVARHARATRVSVVVTRHDGHLTAAVEDDGVGFDPEAAGAGRLGLVGIRERAALAGGELDIESTPGAGTTVLARLPVRREGGPS